jgi:hypothetical protein
VANAQQLFAAWVHDQIAPLLREAGYRGSGQNFHRRFGRNWGVVNFQKSSFGSRDEVSFYVNLGTASAVVLEASGENVEKPPAEATCHWRTRLEELVPGRGVKWKIRTGIDETTLGEITEEVRRDMREVGLPAVEAHISDEKILQALLAGDGHREYWYDVDSAGVLLHAMGGGTEDQQKAFDEQVAIARRFRVHWLAHKSELRPAQGPKRIEANLALLRDPRADRRAEAADQLGRATSSAEVVDALRVALADSDPGVRARAAASLADLGDLPSLDRVLAALRGEERRPRAVDIGVALAGLATRDANLRPQIVAALRERLDRAVGWDLVGFGAILEWIGEAPPA